MRTPTSSRGRACVALAIAVLLAGGCAARSAPDFRGRWQPVNRYAEQPMQIPLQQQYLFYASPLDGTLKAMLTRWAQDARMTLSYLHPSDFTLHGAVAEIRTPDIDTAAAQLSRAYAAQQLLVSVDGNQLVVRVLPPGKAAADTARPNGSRDADGAAAGTPSVSKTDIADRRSHSRPGTRPAPALPM